MPPGVKRQVGMIGADQFRHKNPKRRRSFRAAKDEVLFASVVLAHGLSKEGIMRIY